MKKRALIAVVAVAAIGYGVYTERDSRAMRFLRLAPGRHSPCALADVWRTIGARRALWDRIGEIDDDIEAVRSDPAGFALFRAEDREWWVPTRNHLALAEMLGEQEADVYGSQGHGVRKDDVVLDCGANVGVYTRHALDAGARLVVAIELAPENLECLRRNFAAEIKAGRVIVYPKGVWNEDAELQLRTFGLESGGDSVALNYPGSKEGPKVPLTTIDKLAAELALGRVDFVKMDIEGSEREALLGARETVARWKPRMAISLEHRPDDYEAITGVVQTLWPGMPYSCGPCTWVSTALVNRVQPEELYVGN